MGKLGSRATANTTFPGQFQVREGTFEAELLGMQIYWNDGFQKDSPPELQVGFIVGIDDADATHDPDEDTGLYIHREQFVRLQVDEDGNFSPGGARAKAYKLISAFFGQEFDAFSDEFEWNLESRAFDNMESIEDIPHRKDYDKNEEWLTLDGVTVMGEPIFGKKAMLQFGNAQKPDGSYSDRVTIVGAMAMPKSRRAAAKPGRGKGKAADDDAGGDTPRAAGTRPAGGAGTKDAPAHVKWVLTRLEKAGVVDGEALAFLAHFSEATLRAVTDLTVDNAKSFKGLWEADDGEQIRSLIAEWRASRVNPDEFPDVDEFAEPEPEPVKRAAAKPSKGKLGNVKGGGTAVAERPPLVSIDDEFPPEEDLPF